MFVTYLPILLMLLVAALVAVGMFTATSLAGPKNKVSAEKAMPYEAGSDSTGASHIRLSVKFYLTAILFVVFDIEAVLIYPWTVEFKHLGWVGLATMGS
jgi:NADH-quinone oxidoreductase subunit A